MHELRKIPQILEAELIEELPSIPSHVPEKLRDVYESNFDNLYAYEITYTSQGHKVKGFIIEPKEGNRLPCIIWNRGGHRNLGIIKPSQLFFNVHNIAPLAKSGYIVFISQLSGSKGSEGVDEFGGSEVEDVLELFSLIKSYSRADETRVGMMGSSRGGLMTYLALTKVDWIKAAVVVAGLADQFEACNFRKGWKEHLMKMYGGSESDTKKRSPVYFVEKFPKNVPILMLHGTSDWRVNPNDTLRMGQEFLKYRIPHRLIMYEGADHKLISHKMESNKEAKKWFDRFLKFCEPLPNMELYGK